jgi:threonine/homoserine efflux transporter RhtA
MPSIDSLIRNLSRNEIVSIIIIGITVAVLAWYRTDMTGIQRLTNSIIGLLVSISCATAVTVVLKKLNPTWYSS